MASISISGVGSGIDFNAVRDAIINQKAIPITQLQSKVSRYNSRIDSLKEMNLLLANLTNAANGLTRADLGSGRTATPVDPTVATVAATGTARLGRMTLNVTRLATSLSQASKSYASPNSTILVGNGGGNGNNPPPATFQLRKGGAATGPAITINSANNSLAGLRDAINAANAGVTASIVDISGTGTQNQLVLNSTETGASGRVQLVETSSTNTLSSLTIRNLNPSNGNFSDLDAAVSVNGLSITRSTNDISNAVQGLTISLKKVGSTVVDVSRSGEIEEKLDAFVTSYNAIQDFIAAQYKKDGEGRPSGVLVGDAVLRGVQKQLSTIVGISSTDNGGPLTSLTDIGLGIEKSGQLKLDKDTLKEKLAGSTDDVLSLLRGATGAQTGIFHGAYDISFDLSDSISGTVQNAISGYEGSIKNLNATIEKRTAMLNNMRDILTRQFAAADAAIGQLNGQGTAIGNLMKTLTAGNKD